MNDQWWARDGQGQTIGPFTAAALLQMVQQGEVAASAEISNDRVMWAGVMVHPAFQRATTPGAPTAQAPAGAKKVGWVRRAIGGAVLAWIAYAFIAAWFNTRGVMYYAWGTAGTAWVTYWDENGRSQEIRVALPWTSRNLPVQRGTQVLLQVSADGPGTVHCRINYDTDLMVEREGGEHNSATCSGFAGRTRP